MAGRAAEGCPVIIIVGAGDYGRRGLLSGKEHRDPQCRGDRERGLLSGNNASRNTTIIRSANQPLMTKARGSSTTPSTSGGRPSQELNYQRQYTRRRGVMMLAHNVHDVRSPAMSIPTA